jgi:hypothetical protein
VNTPIDSWSGSYNIEVLRSEALRALEEDIAHNARMKAAIANNDPVTILHTLRHEVMLDGKPRENIFRDSLRGSEGVSGYSFREAFRKAIREGKNPEDLQAFVIDLAETVYVQWVYSVLHGQWHPTTNSGQEGNWKEHRAFLTKLLSIKGQWEDEELES